MNKPEDEKQNDMEKEPIRYERFVEDFNETTMTCLPICNTCVHHIDGLTCKAFDVIPDSILFGENNHSRPLKNQQNNLVYEKKIKSAKL
jgi:hypothetical protein